MYWRMKIGHLLMNYGLASIDDFKDGAHLTCKAEIYVSGQKHKINEKYFLTGCGEKKRGRMIIIYSNLFVIGCLIQMMMQSQK